MLDQALFLLKMYWQPMVVVADIALATTVTYHALLNKRDGKAVILWTGLAWLVPFLGATAYLALGVNRVSRKSSSLEQKKRGEIELA